MNNQQEAPQIYSLEELTLLKVAKLKELREHKKAMSLTAKNIFAPVAPAASKGDAIMRSFNTGMAIFDGIILGVKVMRNFRRLFHKNKKKR